MTEPQWTPAERDIAEAEITAFTRFVEQRTGRDFPDYHALWAWSVEDVEEFWAALWDYFDLGERAQPVLQSAEMPGAQWFPGTEINYVDQVMRHVRTDRPAILHVSEDAPDREVSWAELLGRTAAFADRLRAAGVESGDRVVGYLPNIPEAVVAFLATASIGAVWSACGQDYSAKAALDRLGQLEPKALVAADGYTYAGRYHDKRADVAALRSEIPSLTAIFTLDDLAARVETPLTPARVPFDHPLWVLFSSGTTGLPKGIVHGHGGVVVEHLKAVALQSDIGRDDVFFWYTSPSWMMWNFQVAGLLVGATIVCYDGSPTARHPETLWEIASRVGATVLGTSPGYVLGCMKAEATPASTYDLSALRSVGITGSALPAASSLWLQDQVGVQVASISGGTDVVSAFLGGVRTVPVWPGELSAPYLGVALDAWDEDGQPVRGEVGELVITKPMPSMPVGFWNDRDGSRYRCPISTRTRGCGGTGTGSPSLIAAVWSSTVVRIRRSTGTVSGWAVPTSIRRSKVFPRWPKRW